VIDDTGLQAAKAATKVGCSSSAPNPEKIHRPFWPTRFPKAIPCCTEAVLVRVRSDAISPRGS
jgi:hypothetical protein